MFTCGSNLQGTVQNPVSLNIGNVTIFPRRNYPDNKDKELDISLLFWLYKILLSIEYLFIKELPLILTGHVHNNVITLDNKEYSLPEGCAVKIIPINNNSETDEFCGSWEDERTAEEIIIDIKKARKNRDKDISL